MSKKDWVVDVNRDVDNIEDFFSLVNANMKGKRCIYKVPEYINDKDKEAYKPQVVSLGPYHHDEENLMKMEVHKYRAFLQFLKRSGKPTERYRDALAREVKDLKDAYDQLDDVWLEDDEKFLEMIIIDGCFILEILRVFTSPLNDYSSIDPIFSKHGMLNKLPLIERDMLLLENQVPLRVLEILLDVEGNETTMRTGDYDLIERIFYFFNLDTRSQSQSLINCLHVLDVYRRTLLAERPMKYKRKQITTIEGGNDIIPSATELNETGIRFKTSETKSLMDISIKGSSTLCFPPIVVVDATKSLFLNLMAFERVHVGAGKEVTLYVFFMGCLIKTSRDARLLRTHGIVRNELPNDEDVAQLFKSISRGVKLDNKSGLGIDYFESWLGIVYFEVITKLRDPFWKRLNAWRMDLLQNYLKSPWKVLSIIAAIILFTLASIQTVYTVMSYNHTK